LHCTLHQFPTTCKRAHQCTPKKALAKYVFTLSHSFSIYQLSTISFINHLWLKMLLLQFSSLFLHWKLHQHASGYAHLCAYIHESIVQYIRPSLTLSLTMFNPLWRRIPLLSVSYINVNQAMHQFQATCKIVAAH
jgi:hypothetical protein